MNARLKTLTAFAAGALLAVAGSAVADPTDRAELGMYDLSDNLDLAPNQRAIADELKANMDRDRQAMRQSYQEMLDVTLAELQRPTPDRDRLHAQVDRQLDQARTSAHARLDDFLRLHATLDADQRAQLVNDLQQMRDRHRQEPTGDIRTLRDPAGR